MKSQKNYKIIDAHAHIFPGKIAEKATKSIGSFYDIEMSKAGFPHALVESGEKIGVSTYLVCSTATKPEQVVAINEFIHEKCQKYDKFFGFATLHPSMNAIETEIERICTLGLHGVKLHSDFQCFNIDDPQAVEMYRLLAKKHLPVLFHMGDARYDYSAPRRLADAMEKVPELICIAAHFGGYRRWDEAYDCLAHENVYFDTSSSLFELPPCDAVKMIEHMGEDRFFFGSDFPMWNHEEELERFFRLGLTEEQNEKILHGNFERLFGL